MVILVNWLNAGESRDHASSLPHTGVNEPHFAPRTPRSAHGEVKVLDDEHLKYCLLHFCLPLYCTFLPPHLIHLHVPQHKEVN